VSNSGYPVLPPIQEQIETSTNNDTPHNYKKTRFSLPSQQFTFATHQKQQWPLPPHPTPPIASRPSMGVNAIRIHREITDFLHYQWHVRLTAASSLPPSTRTTHQQEWEVIIEFLKEEHSRIWTLLDMAENNDTELQGLYKDSPVTTDADWGAFTWGPMPQWEDPPQA
jgi:hypothetical protein